jgi:hypothetical protein
MTTAFGCKSGHGQEDCDLVGSALALSDRMDTGEHFILSTKLNSLPSCYVIIESTMNKYLTALLDADRAKKWHEMGPEGRFTD